MAVGVEGVKPSPDGPEPPVQPLHHTPENARGVTARQTVSPAIAG